MENMLTMKAQVLKKFRAPTGERKDGTKYGGETKVQLVGQMPLRNGETRMEMHTLTIRQNDDRFTEGELVSVPVVPFIMNQGKTIGYALAE